MKRVSEECHLAKVYTMVGGEMQSSRKRDHKIFRPGMACYISMIAMAIVISLIYTGGPMTLL